MLLVAARGGLATRARARGIWTSAATVVSADPHTAMKKLQESLASLAGPTPADDPPPALFYTLSKSNPRLQEALDLIRACSSTSAGCLTDDLHDSTQAYHVISLAAFRPSSSHSVVPFFSAIPGRSKIEVGRWMTGERSKEGSWRELDFEAVSEGRPDWRSLWAKENASLQVPEELANLRSQDVRSIAVFTDTAPEGLLEGLDGRFPLADKLGLVASSTPFVTGRPFTMLLGDKVVESGAVGFALCDSSGASSLRGSRLEFNSLSPLGPREKVTSAHDNIISSLSNENATHLLLHRIRQRKAEIGELSLKQAPSLVSKEEDFWAGVYKSVEDADPLCVVRITSGDPSRGSMALEMDDVIEEGSFVQFFERPQTSPASLDHESSSNSSIGGTELRFQVSLPIEELEAVGFQTSVNNTQVDTLVFPKTFIAVSENGFVVSSRDRRRKSWICKVPGSVQYSFL